MNMIDTDAYIEKKQGMKISEIFDKYGESYFRDLEYEACCELSEKSGIIISTGGGALTFERNVEALKKNGTIVLIDVPVDTIKERLKNDTTRPLLQRPDRDKAMQELYDKRLPLYKSAADVVVSGRNTPIKTAFSVIDAVNLNEK